MKLNSAMSLYQRILLIKSLRHFNIFTKLHNKNENEYAALANENDIGEM